MTQHNPALCYAPLIGGSDKRLRTALPAWRASLLASLADALEGGEVHFDGIAVALNQLALLEAYEGNQANALALCEAQIGYWKSVAEAAGMRRHLACAIQPLINIVRLERWNTTADGADSLYRELAPERRGLHGPLLARYGIGLSLAQLCQADGSADYGALLDNVYWREYARSLLQSGRSEPLQALLQQGLSLPLNGFIRLALMEILLLQQASAGKLHSAARLLAKLPMDPASGHWLHFKVLAMYLALRGAAPDGTRLASEVMQALRGADHIQPNGYGLGLLFDISKVFRALGRDADERELLVLAEQAAVALGDEATLFDALDRIAELDGRPRDGLRERFAHSSYALIRKRLGLERRAADPLSALAVQAAQHLARLDYAGCLGVLGADRACRAPKLAAA